MVVNIVRNAIRFSPAGQVVHIETSISDDKLLIRIRDHGPGIPEEYVDKVFDRFIQVPDTSHHFSGAGIGLAIAKSVAISHDASIWARNCSGGGCEFTVAFPLASVASSAPSA
jgi:signal transduction histidine kinase